MNIEWSAFYIFFIIEHFSKKEENHVVFYSFQSSTEALNERIYIIC